MFADCSECQATVGVQHEAHYNYAEMGSDSESTYYFCRCPKCDGPIVMHSSPDGEVSQIYPPGLTAISSAIPEPIRAAYSEAMKCFRSRSFTASAIMCRKTLEGIGTAHNVSGRNLKASLEEMRDKGIIDPRLFEWADTLRIHGNEAAHGVSTIVKRDDARDILEFTGALLEYVFTFRDRFERFQKRRASPAGT